MVYPTEVFVLIINIFGVPLFAAVVRSANLPGAGLFVIAYLCLMLSNIFTVVEGLWLESLFNLLEHASITVSSVFFLFAVRQLCLVREQHNAPADPGSSR
jgi:hypothetical protein